MPRRIYTYAGDLGWDFWNLVPPSARSCIALSILVFIVERRQDSRASGAGGGGRPVGRPHARVGDPVAAARLQLRRDPHRARPGRPLAAEARRRARGRPARPSRAPATAAEIAAIHMPPPSFWPILLALAMALMISGLLISMYQVIVGGLLTLLLHVQVRASSTIVPPTGTDTR